MRKFLILLKKEIKELLTWQLIVPIIIVAIVFVFIGNLIGTETKKVVESQSIVVKDYDKSETSNSIIELLENSNFKVYNNNFDSIEDVINDSKERKANVILIIPSGFEASIKDLKPVALETYTIMRNFSFTGDLTYKGLNVALNLINNHVSSELILNNTHFENPEDLKNPIKATDYVVIGDKKAQISPNQVMGFVTSQVTFIPIVLYLVIIIAAQMIATAIAQEKENKTLETLLSLPVSRWSIVTSKMVASAAIALLFAAIYIFGFSYYMRGITGMNSFSQGGSEIREAIKLLGLVLTPEGYLLIGISLFFAILSGLAIAIILGAFAEDVKGVQGLLAPLMVAIMLPYLLVMFIDISSASFLLRFIAYAIPFSHAFLAAPSLFLGNYKIVIYGILYQAAFFLVFSVVAGHIFSTDRILTMKLSLKKPSRQLS